MVPKVPCGVCTHKIPESSRRNGASGCNACGAFFNRSVISQKYFKCKGTNECLKTPSILARGCPRCRFDKCLEIGMSVTGMPDSNRSSPTQAPAPQPQTPVSPALDKNNVFAATMNSVLTASTIAPSLIVSYLEDPNQDIVLTSLQQIDGLSLTPLLEKTYYLRTLFNIHSISLTEFSVLLQLSICKTTFKWLSVEDQLRISTLQHRAFLTLDKKNLSDQRIMELIDLAQNLLSVFYAYNN